MEGTALRASDEAFQRRTSAVARRATVRADALAARRVVQDRAAMNGATRLTLRYAVLTAQRLPVWPLLVLACSLVVCCGRREGGGEGRVG